MSMPVVLVVSFAVLALLAILAWATRAARRPIEDDRSSLRDGSDSAETVRGGLTRRGFVGLGLACGAALGVLKMGWTRGAGASLAPVSKAAAVVARDEATSVAWARAILPMHSGRNVLPGDSVRVTSRPQSGAFLPDRMVLSGGDDWRIDGVEIGGTPQLREAVPGNAFAATALDSLVRFSPVMVASDFAITATYVGHQPGGAPFVCGVLGRVA